MSAGARIDPAHTPANSEDKAEAPPLDPAPDAETAAEQIRTQAAQLAQQLRLRQKDLDYREARLNAWAAQLESDARVARLWLSQRTAEAGAEGEHSSRTDSQSMSDAEASLARGLAEVEKLREQLMADRSAAAEERAAEERRMEAEHRQALAEVEERRRAVQRRSQHVDQCRAALLQLRAETGRMHRETLEIRLATEELWAQLAGAAPPAALTQSLGRIRSRLADHYRLANAELHEQKEELERLRDLLSEQHAKLSRQKREIDTWAAACRQEVEEQSARLIARAQELDRREAEIQERLCQVR
jgi:hypothetical protein